jgi:hypothetical protein
VHPRHADRTLDREVLRLSVGLPKIAGSVPRAGRLQRS